jgi:alginate O-acetyltransferase complex protein AlgI
MLFNSWMFIGVFLPITLLGYSISIKKIPNYANLFLVLSSLIFYSYWDIRFTILFLISIMFNYGIGYVLIKFNNSISIFNRKDFLIFGLVVNLCSIIYFKYSNFFIENYNYTFNADIPIITIVLPLAISFYTFQQIAFLVDAYRNKIKQIKFSDYMLFVSFFPQLIAGPIVHHKEMIKQFTSKIEKNINYKNISIGITIFAIGLFKKVVIADNLSFYVNEIYSVSDNGITITFIESWAATLAYTLQIYYDFSGYSDMAIGLANMFAIKLPLNFNSPYKANNIIEFWRRWHITLSRFLKEYLYIPLGGNKNGKFRRHLNLLITMFLGGLWHGAGYNFIIWGTLHGVYLIINHSWITINKSVQIIIPQFISSFLTIFGVIIAWVFFRSETTVGAVKLLKSMFGFNGVQLPVDLFHKLENLVPLFNVLGVTGDGIYVLSLGSWAIGIPLIFVIFLFTFILPNTNDIMKNYTPTINSDLEIVSKNSCSIYWRPTIGWAIIISFLASIGIMSLNQVSEFLYFQF